MSVEQRGHFERAEPRAVLDRLDASHAAATPGAWSQDEDWMWGIRAGGEVIASAESPVDAAAIAVDHNAQPQLTSALRGVLDLADEMSDEDLHAVRFFAHRIGAVVAAALTPDGDR